MSNRRERRTYTTEFKVSLNLIQIFHPSAGMNSRML